MAPIANRIIPLFSAFLIIIAAVVAPAQVAGRKIARIEIAGLQRLSADEVVATSGLKTGEPFSVGQLDAAAQKLVDSGLFTKVGYRTTTKGTQVTIVFQVVESKGGSSRVVYDNFVWFTNEELTAAIRRDVPAFDGSAPNAGTMTDRIRQALQNLLKERQIEGNVEYAPTETGEHLYTIAGVHIPICRLHFPGATNVPEDKLVLRSRQLTEDSFSLKAAIAFAQYTLFPIYREAGQWRAKFAEPIVKTLVDEPDCKRGVELSIPVAEGPIYMWDKAEWTGNEVLTPIQLDATLAMKNGELANGARFDKGLHELTRRYGLTGHLDVRFGAKPEFDDTAARLTVKIAVNEGPQYLMGKLTITGVSSADVVALEQRWKLRRGDVFDTTYPERFLKTDGREELQRIAAAWQAQGKRPPAISFETTPNRPAVVADVALHFKDPD
jgi:outer membrane protein insertion porin family